MRNIFFLKEPGYTYDLFSLFCFWFNKRENMAQTNATNDGEAEYVSKHLNEYLPISDDLRIFFYKKENVKMFMSEYYFEPFRRKMLTAEYGLEMVLEALTDYKQVIHNICQFYFENYTNKECVGDENYLVYISNLIKNSSYSGDVKSILYAFFIDPESAIQKLIYELKTKDILLAKEYTQRQAEIKDLQNGFDYEKVAEGLVQITKQQIDITSFQNVCISFCLNNKNLLCWTGIDDVDFLFLGSDYINSIRRLIESDIKVQLDVFGNVISEVNRIEILNFLLSRGEANIKDLERELKLAGTNAYYHLSLMLKAGLLKSRNQGRMVLYSINTEYFYKLCDMLKKYTVKK